MDAEFDGFNGPLLTIALVSADLIHCFYAAIKREAKDPWVRENVVPVIGMPVLLDEQELAVRLGAFLGIVSAENQYEPVLIIADWPEDIAHLCRALITGPGKRASCPNFKTLVDFSLSSEASVVPHNALCDAHAIRNDWVNNLGHY